MYVFPETCIQQNIRNIQVITFEYILVLYPMLLVLVTYIAIELHARYCRLVVYLWKPFNKCFAKVRKNISAGNSIIHAYATFFFLSFSILTYISFNLLSTTDVYNRHGTVTKRVVVYDPRIESFGHEHLPYAITAMLLFILLGVVPTFFLCLYPTRFSAKFSRFATARMRLNLKIFVETFQGCLRNGVNGGCDFRFVSGAPMLLAQILARNFISYVFDKPVVLYVGVPVVAAVLSVGVVYMKPYKSLFMNLSTSFHLVIVCLSGGVIALWFYGGTMINSRF